MRDDFDPERSDVDFLVEFSVPAGLRYSKNFFALQKNFTALLGRPVDLVIDDSLRNPYIRESVDAQKELLYAA